jgi:hypothetical protein
MLVPRCLPHSSPPQSLGPRHNHWATRFHSDRQLASRKCYCRAATPRENEGDSFPKSILKPLTNDGPSLLPSEPVLGFVLVLVLVRNRRIQPEQKVAPKFSSVGFGIRDRRFAAGFVNRMDCLSS